MIDFQGIYAVTITPFREDGSIDYDFARAHMAHMLRCGVHGLLPLGATGEFASLSVEERCQYAECIVKEVDGKVPVVIGAVSQNIDTSLHLVRHAQSIGAAGVMLLPAPGLHLRQDEIYAYYAYFANNSTIPIMVYNNPGSAGVDICPDTMERIAALSNVQLLKESSGDIARLTRAVDDLSHELTVFCGCESLAYESFIMGAKAWVCVLANIAPRTAVTLYDLIINQGKLQEARELNKKILPILRVFEESGELWQVAKYVLEKQGFGKTYLRRPRAPISEATKARVDDIFQQYKTILV